MAKKIFILLIFMVLIIPGCTNSTTSEVTTFSMESMCSDIFEEDMVSETIAKYSENPDREQAIQLFLKYFSITEYKDGYVYFSTLDTTDLLEVLNNEDLKDLGTQSNLELSRVLQILSEKSDLPTIDKNAQVVKNGNTYVSNYFIAENLGEFLDTVLQNGVTTVESLLRNYKIFEDDSIKSLELKKSIILQTTSQDKKFNLCLTIEELLAGQEALNKLKEKNALNSYELKEGTVPVYLQYTIVNLSESSIKSPDNFLNISSTYEECNLEKQPSGLNFPATCEPLEETKYEKVFLLENEKSNIYWIDNNQIFYLVRIGGNDEE